MSCDRARNMAEEAPERRLGEYILGRTLGKGARAKVKQAVDGRTGKKVALKVLKKADAGMSEARTEVSVMKEYMAKAEDTSCLLNLHEVLESSNHVYLVLELMPDGDLFDSIAKGPIPERVARPFLKQAVAGLAALHGVGIAHRDVKPENILIDVTRGVAKLSDFGFSKIHKNYSGSFVDLSQAAVGTTVYAAPEVLESHSRYNAFKADCYSIGVTMYTALTGTFPNKSGGAMNFKHGRGARLSAEVQDLILGLMELAPDMRLTAAEALTHPWFAADIDAEEAGSLPPSSSCEDVFTEADESLSA
eukprot:TRINITY_DN28_c0_g2_i1.p2 TRINITY_DN28_c0_g2~~TRINITY_DN28_c0_g2_i1.p2  ORF type:complete len:305 (+),score=125.75 TRINITY_DN28_c0_g2_i1:57-971(+)